MCKSSAISPKPGIPLDLYLKWQGVSLSKPKYLPESTSTKSVLYLLDDAGAFTIFPDVSIETSL